MFAPEEGRSAARQLNQRAESLRRAGRVAEAEPLYLQALALHERFSPPDSVDWAICRDNLGNLYFETGRVGQAISLHHEALKILEGHPEEHLDIAIAANNLGFAYSVLGNQRAAETYLVKAAQRHELSGRLSTDYVGTLLNLARVRSAQHDLDTAESLLRRALSLCTEIGEASVGLQITGQSSLASVLTDLGRYDEARSSLEDAVRQAELFLGPNHLETLTAKANLGELYRRLDDLPGAESALKYVLESLTGDPRGMSPLGEAIRTNLALTYEARGRPTEALPLFAANVESELLRSSEILRHGAEQERLLALMQNRGHLVTFLGFVLRQHVELPMLAGMALDFWLKAKALGGAVLRAYRTLTPDTQSQEVAETLSRLATLHEEIAEEIRITSFRFVRSYDEWLARTERLNRLRNEADELERSVVPLLPGFSLDAVLQGDPVKRLFSRLPTDTALLEFTGLCPPPEEGAPGGGRLLSPEELGYAVFVLRGDESGQVRMVELGSGTDIANLVADTHRALGGGPGARSFVPDSKSGQASTELPADLHSRLRAHLGDRLGPAVAGLRRLIVCPDSALWSLPFQVLPAGSDRYWIDDFEISYMTTGRDLLRSSPEQERQPRSSPVVVAAPQFSLDPAVKGPYSSLDGALREGEEVAANFNVEPLLGARATKAAVMAVSGPTVLHVATHGFFDDRFGSLGVVMHETGAADADDPYADPEFQRLLRLVDREDATPVKSATITDSEESVADMSSQLLHSGLAFAGANDARRLRQVSRSRDPEQLDYGELLATDLAELDLTGTQLVVLSACDTGLGDIFAGEGVWGFQLALRVAGAQAVVMSLWKVDDEATRALMANFYHHLLAGKGKASALREAAIEVRRSWPHPRFWASFVCLGDDRPLKLK